MRRQGKGDKKASTLKNPKPMQRERKLKRVYEVAQGQWRIDKHNDRKENGKKIRPREIMLQLSA
jgi:hypothetical protein